MPGVASDAELQARLASLLADAAPNATTAEIAAAVNAAMAAWATANGETWTDGSLS